MNIPEFAIYMKDMFDEFETNVLGDVPMDIDSDQEAYLGRFVLEKNQLFDVLLERLISYEETLQNGL